MGFEDKVERSPASAPRARLLRGGLRRAGVCALQCRPKLAHAACGRMVRGGRRARDDIECRLGVHYAGLGGALGGRDEKPRTATRGDKRRYLCRSRRQRHADFNDILTGRAAKIHEARHVA
jgi:hypothetical protein